MIERIIIAGAGGQGVMLLGKVLAEAAIRENKQVTWLPCYGAEVRGGTAYCMVVISSQEIGSPFIDKADTLIIMNNPSLNRFKNRLDNKGLCIINASLSGECAHKNILRHPFSDIALRLGNVKVANMVALGSYLSRKKIAAVKTILKVFSDIAPKDKLGLVEINRKALEEGYKLK